jgi:hypothetical protein
LIYYKKKAYKYWGLPSPAFSSAIAWDRTDSMICIFSSVVNRLGTSPVFNRLFISSTNPSSLIYVSPNMKRVDSYLHPANIMHFFKSLYQSNLE